jgi:hypothetical protein
LNRLGSIGLAAAYPKAEQITSYEPFVIRDKENSGTLDVRP